MLAALLSVLTTLGIVISLVGETIVFFGEVGIVEFLFGTDVVAALRGPAASASPARGGYAPGHRDRDRRGGAARPRRRRSTCRSTRTTRVRKAIKPVLEVLAGVPTIVFGYFALTFFTPVVLRDLLGFEVGVFNALSAGIVMGFMVLPTVASVSEDAMSAVPAGAARGRLRARRLAHAGGGAGRVPGRAVGHRRGDRARRVTRDRRDHDRAGGRRAGAQPDARPARVGRDHDHVHRRDRGRRHPDRDASSTRRSSRSARRCSC